MIEIKGTKTIVFGYELVIIYKMYPEVNKFTNLKILIFDINKDLSSNIIYENCEFVFMLNYDKNEIANQLTLNYQIDGLLNLTFIETNNSFFDEIFQKYNFYNLTSRQKIIYLNYLINQVLTSSYIMEYIPYQVNIFNPLNKPLNITFNILKKKIADTQISFDIDDIVINLYQRNITLYNQEVFKNLNYEVA